MADHLTAVEMNALNSLGREIQTVLKDYFLARNTLEEWVSQPGRPTSDILESLCRYFAIDASADAVTTYDNSEFCWTI